MIIVICIIPNEFLDGGIIHPVIQSFYNYDVTELQQKKNALEQLADKILPFPE